MPEMILNCPHCASERMGFVFVGEFRQSAAWHDDDPLYVWNAFCACRKCQEGVVVKLASTHYKFSPSNCVGDPCDEGFFIVGMHPMSQTTGVPEHVPEDIAKDFGEAMDNVRRKNWTSAGMMFRKVLQRATRGLAPEGVDFTRMKLVQRIDALNEKRLITPAMKDWAHAIRLDGNEATHEEDEEFSDHKGSEMKDFTEVFLLYAFTLPTRVAAHRRQEEHGRLTPSLFRRCH